MADIEFRISTGPYAGDYAIDVGDITANDVGDLLAQHGPDLDEVLMGGSARGTRAIAALIWVVRRRGNKGLSYRAIADHVTLAIVEPIGEPDTAGDTAGLPDPSPSADV
jgi:hypothetical protein